MAWPFPEYVRPLMRSVLYYQAEGLTREEITETLTGPGHGHSLADVNMAYPEAQRARLFAENIEAFGAGQTFGALWQRYWLPIFSQAYGRAPTEAERGWAQSRPSDVLGLKARVTVEGIADFASTPTLNVPWDATWAEVQDFVEGWFRGEMQTSPKSGTIEGAISEGAKINVTLKGGALVELVDRTLELGR